jgi:hypothetical protein
MTHNESVGSVSATPTARQIDADAYFGLHANAHFMQAHRADIVGLMEAYHRECLKTGATPTADSPTLKYRIDGEDKYLRLPSGQDKERRSSCL